MKTDNEVRSRAITLAFLCKYRYFDVRVWTVYRGWGEGLDLRATSF